MQTIKKVVKEMIKNGIDEQLIMQITNINDKELEEIKIKIKE